MRDLTLEEFQQFRMQVEPMNEDELAMELRLAQEEFDRESDEIWGDNEDNPFLGPGNVIV